MTDSEAIEICDGWFAYLQRQREKTIKLQELAALARKGSAGSDEARRKMQEIDRSPTVYDGARLEPAVRHLVATVQSRHNG